MKYSAEEPDRRRTGAAGSSAGLMPATRRVLLQRAATAQADGRLPSLAAAVVRDGAQAWSAGRGTVDGAAPTGDTQYRIGSLTKVFVALAVMRLRDEGRLRLTDPLGQHMPAAGIGELRIGELLAHTAGLAAEPPGPWWERTPGTLRPQLPDLLGPGALRHPAGRRFHYSNVGFAVLGALVATLRGRPWQEVVQDEILGPLGMSRTGVAPQPPYATGWAVHPWADVLLPEPDHDAGLMAPAGQFWSTTGDLCRFATFLSTGASGVLPAESLAEMREPAAPSRDGAHDTSHGLGLQLMWAGGRMLYGHTGAVPGFIAALWVGDDGLGAVALANTTSGYTMASLAADLIALTREHEPAIPPEWRPVPDMDPAVLALTGTWYWGPAPHILRAHPGNELSLTPLTGGGPPTRFRPAADGTWTGTNGYHAGETLRAITRPDGSVSHLESATFVFTREPYADAALIPGGVDPAGWR
jgi:CubicO group peptidase (beta-lactamase class C family)